MLRAGETVGAGVLARAGDWSPHRVLAPALRPIVRWLLFGDEYEPAALELTMGAFGRTSLRSIGGFRASVGAQRRLETLATLTDLPAAVLVGDRDRLTPPPCASSIAGALPGAELTVLATAGHMLMLERPAEVTGVLTGLVEEALSRSARRRAPGRRPARTLDRAA